VGRTAMVSSRKDQSWWSPARNNGADGFVAAAELAARGPEVFVILLCERDSLQGDAALACTWLKYPVLRSRLRRRSEPALIIDCAGVGGRAQLVPQVGDHRSRLIEAGQRQRRAVLVGRSAEDQRAATARDGRCDQRRGDRAFFPRKPAHLLMPGRKQTAAVSASPISASIPACSRNPAADVGERSAKLAKIIRVPVIGRRTE